MSDMNTTARKEKSELTELPFPKCLFCGRNKLPNYVFRNDFDTHIDEVSHKPAQEVISTGVLLIQPLLTK